MTGTGGGLPAEAALRGAGPVRAGQTVTVEVGGIGALTNSVA